MIPVVDRVRLLVAEHGLQVALALALVGTLALGGAVWTVANPPTERVTERAHVQTVATDVDTRAYVAGDTAIWDRGTWIENGRIYPLGAAPHLRLNVTTAVPSGTDVRVTQELSIRYRAARGDTVFWEESAPLARESVVTKDGRAGLQTSVDVRRVRDRLNQLDQELTGIGTASAVVVLNVSYDSGRYRGTLTTSAPLEVGGSAYWLEGGLGTEEERGTQVVREVRRPANWAAAALLAAVGLGFLGGAWGVLRLGRRGIDPRAARTALERSRYASWISTGQLRRTISGQDIPMASIGDLVDLAIDTDRRVVHDPARDLYAVIAGDVIYYYDPYEESTGPGIATRQAEREESEPEDEAGLVETVVGMDGGTDFFRSGDGATTKSGLDQNDRESAGGDRGGQSSSGLADEPIDGFGREPDEAEGSGAAEEPDAAGPDGSPVGDDEPAPDHDPWEDLAEDLR